MCGVTISAFCTGRCNFVQCLFWACITRSSWSAKRWIMWVPLRSLSQWLTDAAIGKSDRPHIHPVNRCKFQTRCATLTPSPFLLSNCVLCLPSTCIHYLTSSFPQLQIRWIHFSPLPKSHSWDFGNSHFFSSIKIKSSSRLACFILLATTWRI